MEQKSPPEDAKSLLAKAEAAERTGNLGAARVYLQMAARRSEGALREEALAKYNYARQPRETRGIHAN
jgi:hypothetical protein